jgi:tRNA (guanine-N7-)-methyltransferase
MRTRFKPYARPELAAWDYYIGNPLSLKGGWSGRFVNSAFPLRVELGCGKGSFLAALSRAEPNYNYLGIDIKSEMLVVAKRTIDSEYKTYNKPINNILITSWNIEKIEDILDKSDLVQRVYINFCNPWYKSGHAKHRLTHPRQLLQIRSFLCHGGEVWFKTDDSLLYNDSLRYFSILGFEIHWQTNNLHQNEPGWNIRTEHEKMFSQRGISIKACIARMLPEENFDKAQVRRMKNI